MKNSTACAANDDMHRPVILYEVPDGPQDRDYQCSHYHDCVSRVSLDQEGARLHLRRLPLQFERDHQGRGARGERHAHFRAAALHPGNGPAGEYHPRF